MGKRSFVILMKLILWVSITLVSLLLIACILFSFPSIQTKTAQKIAQHLSKQMNTHVGIETFRITWNLDIQAKGVVLKDLHGNNLIAAKECSCDFPSYDKQRKQLNISNIHAKDAEVFLAIYENEEDINLRFFTDFLKPEEPSDVSTRISLKNIQIHNGKFTFYNEANLDETYKGHWNYSNIVLNDIDLKMEELLIINDSLRFNIKELSCKERSGFHITAFKGNLRISSSGIYCQNTVFTTAEHSHIALDFGFKYNDYIDFQDFNNKIAFDCQVYPSSISLLDLVYFVPAFKGMNHMLTGEIMKVEGCLSDMHIEAASLKLDADNEILTDISIKGLPDIKETLISANIRSLRIRPDDIETFALPNQQYILLPDIVKRIEHLQAKGSFRGYYNDFIASADIKTPMGNISLHDCSLNTKAEDLHYKGNFIITDFQLNKLIDYKDIGAVTASGYVDGKAQDIESAFVTISSITFKQSLVTDIEISGNFHQKQLSFSLISDDKLLKSAINGMINFNREETEYTLAANIDTLNISKLNLFRSDSNAIASAAEIKIDLIGNKLENFKGKVEIINLSYQENDKTFPLDDIRLSINAFDSTSKEIHLNSSSLSIHAKGDFTYEDIVPVVQNELHNYLPHAIPKSNKSIRDSMQNIDLEINMLGSIPLFELYFPQLVAKEGLHLKTNINSQRNYLKLSANIPLLVAGQQKFQSINLQSNNISDQLFLSLDCDSYWMSNDTLPFLENIHLRSRSKNDTIAFTVLAGRNTSGTIKDVFFQGNLGFMDKKELFCYIHKGSLVIDTSKYLLDDFNYAHFSKDSIYIKNLGFRAEKKRINIQGALSSLHNTTLYANFTDIPLEQFDVLFKKFMIDLGGNATGKASIISNQFGYNVISNFEVLQFTFNHVLLGTFQGKTIWHNDNKRLLINASVIPDHFESQDLSLHVYGYFDPITKTIDLNGDIQEFNIKILEPYLAFFSSKVEGIGTGYLSFSGPIKNPSLRGNIHLANGVLGIDFLHTEYYLNHCNIGFIDTGFIFENIRFEDVHKNQGTVNGIITHEFLKKWKVDLDINTNRMLVLNTQSKDNDLFFGRAFASGDVSIKTQDEVTWITTHMKTERPTNLTVKMDWNTSVKENKFIVFEKENISINLADTQAITAPTTSSLGVSLGITATPDAHVRIELDPSIGGVISGTGSGSLRLDLTPDDKFQMFGTYILNNGSFELNLGDILARNFTLEKGGTVTWNGEPADGQIAVKAVYPTRVSISELLTDNQTTTANRPIPVKSILYLNGNILNPEFNFGIELADDVDENLKTLVFNAIDTTDRKEMVSQTFSVLLLGRFEASDINNTTMNLGLGYSLSELASHHLNKWMSTITENVNLGFSYRPGDGGGTADGYNVQVSTNLLDNRLVIQGSLDIYDDHNQSVQTDKQAVAGNVVGDIIVEYKLTKDGSLRIKAFNLANYYDILQSSSMAPYSQGLGISYIKHFNTLRELFVSKKKWYK